ncbi:MAG: metallophosphoesterase [Anaerolineae bacterium]|nr:metallophosphoesterase [Anaerolineae bacterium]
MVTSWNPDFIVTVGDNNYPSGAEETIDDNIGQLYGDYIGNYNGNFGNGSALNNFYPILGNHDWRTGEAGPYFEYFTLAGNERYYDFVRGPIHFFMLDSHRLEPDGIDDESIQAQWLQSVLATSTSPFQVVIAHHPPYSSSEDNATPALR